MGQVTEAVGNAVGQLYATFQQQTTVTDQGGTYSQNFQDQIANARMESQRLFDKGSSARHNSQVSKL